MCTPDQLADVVARAGRMAWSEVPATLSRMKRQSSTLDRSPAGIIELANAAAERALQARSERANVADADIDALLASWQLRHTSPDQLTPSQLTAGDTHGFIAIEVGTRMVSSKLTAKLGRRSWLAARREEVIGDAQVWVVKQLSEYRPGTGSAAAFLASRLDWIVSDILRTHGQGAGTLDRNAYQVRAALWNVLASRREAGLDISPAALRDATLDQLCAPVVRELVAAGLPAAEARTRAVAALKKSGKYAALDRIGEFLTVGENDLSLEQPITDGMTLGDVVSSEYRDADVQPGQVDEEDALTEMYRVALGDNSWAVPAFVARLGALGTLEGSGTIDVEDGISPTRPASIPNLAIATGRSKEDVRKIMNDAPVRLGAPHAHFAHLSLIELHTASNAPLAGFDRSIFADN